MTLKEFFQGFSIGCAGCLFHLQEIIRIFSGFERLFVSVDDGCERLQDDFRIGPQRLILYIF